MYVPTKGQIISEWLLDVFIWTKKRTKIFLYFCPTSKNRPNKNGHSEIIWPLVWSDDCRANWWFFFTSFNTTQRPYWGPTETLSAQREHGFYRIKCDDVEKITAINQLESTFILHSLWQGRKDFGWPNRPVWGYWPIYSPHRAQRLAWPHFLRTKLHSPPDGDFCPRIWAS